MFLIASASWMLAVRVDPAAARKAPPAPCNAARYLIIGDPILGKTAGVAVGPSVSLDALCNPVAPKRLKANRKGVTTVVAKWPQCDGLTGAVVLKAKILSGCTTLQGTLKAKKFKQKINAAKSRCGDGIVDPGAGDECDDGNAIAGDGCEPDCSKTPSTGNLPTTTPTSSTNPSMSTTTSTTFGTVPTTHATTSTMATTTSSSTSTTTLPKTVLALALIANPDPVVPGGIVTYTLTATNLGPANAVQAQLRMTLPAGVFTCGTPSDGGQLPTGCAAAHDVVWALGTMAVDTSRTVQIAVQFRGDVVSGTMLNATARLDDAAFSPQATAQTSVVAETGGPLSLGLGGDPDPVPVGGELEYVLRFG